MRLIAPRRSKLASVLLGTLFIPSLAGAEDWPRFRGPNGSGRAATAFSQPIAESDFLWKVTLPGGGHSSPSVRGDRVYVTAAERDTARQLVVCLSAADGKTLWTRAFESKTHRMHNDNSYASATPAVDDVGVYVAFTTPDEVTLLALDHDGKDLWKNDLGRYVSAHGSGVSPIVVGETVILTNDQEGPTSNVMGFDRKTGKVRWEIKRKPGNKMAASTPCLFAPKGGGPAQLILTSKAAGITSVDPQTGEQNWEVPEAFTARTVGSPVVSDELVIGTAGEGGSDRQLTAVRPGARPGDKPAVAYKIGKSPPYVPTLLVAGDLLFLWGDGGLVTCVLAGTGETVWTEKVGGAYYGSPVLAGDTIWCMSKKGELVGIAASEKFKLVGKLELGEATHATPAIAGGKMYLRTMTQVICVGKK